VTTDPLPTTHAAPSGPVLVIDDDAACRELMLRSLSRAGFDVIVAATGEEGLQRLRDTYPLVIFLDLVLPGMSGWDVLTAVGADPRLAGVPVVIMTMLDERKKAQALGAADFLLKPVDRARLASLMHTFRPAAEPAAEPAQAPPAAQAPAPAPAAAPDSGGPVLLVEDDPTNRQLLARLLRKQGMAVVEAGDGRSALERVGEATPSLIILDLMLPVMDGITFVQQLRKDPARRAIPIIVLTAKDLTAEDRGRLGDSVRKVLQKGSCKREDVLGEINRARVAS
jgi:CheY-like chemotaxis protein